MAKAPDRWRPLLLMLVILPFWTSFLIRVYAWIGILKNEGLLNNLLLWTRPDLAAAGDPADRDRGLYRHRLFLPAVHDPAALRQPREARPDPDRGRGRSRLHAVAAFWKVTIPLAVPGIIAGCLLVFIPAVGEFVIPDLLGGSDTLMIGKVLWTEFFNNRDWPLASAVAIAPAAGAGDPDRPVPAPAGGAHRGAPLMGRGFTTVHRDRPHPGLRLPLPADRAPGDLLVQRLQAGHRLGRLLAASGTASMLEQPGRCSIRPGSPCAWRRSPRPWR